MLFQFIFSLIIAFFISTNSSLAHHGGEGGLGGGAGIAGPIVTIPAYPLPKGSKFISLITNYNNENIFSDSKLSRLGKRGEEVDIVENTLTPSLTVGYGFTEKSSLSASIPYLFKFGIRRVEESPVVTNKGNSIGVGDINLFGLYELVHSEKHDLHTALLYGLKIPTGVRRTKDHSGNIYKAEHQPSTGSWDPSLGLSVSKHAGILHLDANGMYRFSTKGIQDTTLGDIVSYNLATSYLVGTKNTRFDKLFPKKIFGHESSWHLIGEINGSWVEKPKSPEGREENEGGTLVYLSPGMRLILDKKWVTNLSVGLPTIHNLNGRRQPPNVRVILGVTRVF
jgi:hypothetical protein